MKQLFATILILCVLVSSCSEKHYTDAPSPEDALRSFDLNKDFYIELFSAEPFVLDPIEMVFDEKDNAFVVEMPDYPFRPESGIGTGRIRIISDTNGDGRVDRSTIFADSLLEATSILPWKDGLIVALSFVIFTGVMPVTWSLMIAVHMHLRFHLHLLILMEDKEKYASEHFYELTIGNKGGLVMPIIVEWNFKDGTKEIDRIPAQIWRYNEKQVSRLFMKDKEVTSIELDPMRETADINESNNTWGTIPEPVKFSVFKQKAEAARGQSQGINLMQKDKKKILE
jgi:hypothetical protein